MERGDQETARGEQSRKEEGIQPEEIEVLKEICETWRKAGLSFPETIRLFPLGPLTQKEQEYYQRILPVLDKIEAGEI